MDLEILEKIGLTKSEIRIYLALLKLGSTTTGPLLKETGLHRSRVYDGLQRLINRGLVSFVVKANRKYFSAADPSRLVDYADEIKKEIKDSISDLIKLKIGNKKEQEAFIFEGIKGIKSVLEGILKILKKGDTLYVLGSPGEANEKLEGYFKDFHKRRIKLGIKMSILYNENAREYGELRKKWSLTKVKYMSKDIITPAWIDIYEDNIAILLIGETPLAFVLKNKKVAESFKEYFKAMWKIAKK